MRIILYTGKGGVGKTSMTAATAVRCADLGLKTIAISTDVAHSLSDSFGVDLSGGEPRNLESNLWAQETNTAHAMQVHWDTVRSWVASMLAWRGVDEILADEMAILPGMDELASLLYIAQYYDSSDYDVILVDCAPTGETLRLLSLPDILKWWMERMFPIGRAAIGILRPVVKPLLGIPMPGEEVFNAQRQLFEQISRMHSILSNPDISSIRLVVNAEKMVIQEAKRTFTYLNLYGYFTDLVVCNRLIPDSVVDPYFAKWKQVQAGYRETIEQSFSPIPVLNVPLFDHEMVGVSNLRDMGTVLFGDKDPSQIFYRGHTQTTVEKDGVYVMTLVLPFIQKSDVSLVRKGDELLVQVGQYRRNITLPHALLDMTVQGAKLENELLKISFAKAPTGTIVAK
jgi:arsenite/tail-anchored protein-transporting ATPase